jgi:putative membrane protein
MNRLEVEKSMKKKSTVVLSIIIGLLMIMGVLGPGVAMAAGGRGGAFMHRPDMWGGGARGFGQGRLFAAPFILVGLLLILAAAAVLVFLIVRRLTHNKTIHHGSGGDALEILKERYAKGEIAKEEFEAIKKDILE